MDFKKQYQDTETKDLLKIILEDNSTYTREALIEIIELVKERGDISKLILENYPIEKLIELIFTKKDYIPEIKSILDVLVEKNKNIFEQAIKIEKDTSGKINLVISETKVTQMNRDLVGNVFITDKCVYFITTKVKNLPKNLPAFYATGGVLFGLVGEIIDKLTNKPKTFEKNDEIPLNILARYIDGSFKINLADISSVCINNRNNFFAIETKDKKQSQHFSAKNSEDNEKAREAFVEKNIPTEFAKGFFKKLFMG